MEEKRWVRHLLVFLTARPFSDELSREYCREQLFDPEAEIRWRLLKLIWVCTLCWVLQIWPAFAIPFFGGYTFSHLEEEVKPWRYALFVCFCHFLPAALFMGFSSGIVAWLILRRSDKSKERYFELSREDASRPDTFVAPHRQQGVAVGPRTLVVRPGPLDARHVLWRPDRGRPGRGNAVSYTCQMAAGTRTAARAPSRVG